MTTPQRFERDLPVLLEDLYLAGTPDYRDDLVRRIAATRQRPAWTFRERWIPVDIATTRVPATGIPWRSVGILAVVTLLIVAALTLYVGSQRRLPEPFGVAANGSIVYSQDGDIMVRDGLDGQSRVLIGGPETDVWAGFSPKGDRMVIVREAGEGHDLWTARDDGSDLRRIGGPYLDGNWIEWSPDQSTIAVAHNLDGRRTISLAATDGSGERPLTDMPAEQPAWRPPDGAQLLFRGNVGTRWGLYVVDVASGGEPIKLELEQGRLEGTQYDLMNPVWSPDGTTLAYHTLIELPDSQLQTPGMRIRTASISPSGTVVDTRAWETSSFHDDELHPVFTPDGTSLVFQVRTGWSPPNPATGTPTIDRLFLLPLDGTRRAQDLGVVSTNGDGIGTTVAPDGTSIIAQLWAERQAWVIDPVTHAVREADFATTEGVSWQRRAPSQTGP